MMVDYTRNTLGQLPSGFNISGVFRDQGDFGAVVLFPQGRSVRVPRFSHLPDRDIVGLTLDSSELLQLEVRMTGYTENTGGMPTPVRQADIRPRMARPFYQCATNRVKSAE
jgi:hypothetical protein